MSRLSVIRQTLEEKAAITHVEEENIPIDICMSWPRRIDFYIAPNEPLYKADELNAFLDSLIPDIEPSYKTYFRQEKTALITGAFCFDEKIGYSVTRTEKDIIIDDEELAKVIEKEKLHSYKVDARDYMRRIIVRPYPNKEIIEKMLHRNLSRWNIPMELIYEYHDDRKWWQKLFQKIHHPH
ncbi:MAG: hypothetical protein PHO02_01900 [Candidatus Nanoarchaeia archaeon]|nr:hypothetical protein [Candidatus Nanoarchaeia archaeon]